MILAVLGLHLFVILYLPSLQVFEQETNEILLMVMVYSFISSCFRRWPNIPMKYQVTEKEMWFFVGISFALTVCPICKFRLLGD